MSIYNLLTGKPDYIGANGSNLTLMSCAEKQLGLVFAEEYKEYLQNIGLASYDGHELTGICTSKRLNVVDVTLAARKTHPVPADWYVIEEANIDDVVIWQAPNGTIYQSTPWSKPQQIANCFSDYVLSF